jgi:nitrile hydratase alpha subunit
MDEREKKLLGARQAAEAHLIERSWTDREFRERLLRDPKATLSKELGIEFPDDAEIEVLEETTTKKYLVLPEPAAGDLSDEELERVAGGIRALNSLRIRRDSLELRDVLESGALSIYFFGRRD